MSHHGCHGKDHGVVGAYGPPSSLELCIGLSAEQGTGRQDSGQAWWTPEKHRRLGPRPAPQVTKLGTTWQQFGDILARSTSGRFLPRESNCLQGKPILSQIRRGQTRANARFQRAERLLRWGDKGRDPAASRGSTASCMFMLLTHVAKTEWGQRRRVTPSGTELLCRRRRSRRKWQRRRRAAPPLDEIQTLSPGIIGQWLQHVWSHWVRRISHQHQGKECLAA